MAHSTVEPVARRDVHDERGDIILGWFTRVAVFLMLIGIVAFECISLVTARVNGADLAGQIASAAADAYAQSKDVDTAYAAAETKAIEGHAEISRDTFVVRRDGSVDVEVQKTATTLFLYRTDTTAKWAVVHSEGHANGAIR
ncbi:MAG: hypothetical protein ABIM89_06965 [Mycobacteriales bacterium]